MKLMKFSVTSVASPTFVTHERRMPCDGVITGCFMNLWGDGLSAQWLSNGQFFLGNSTEGGLQAGSTQSTDTMFAALRIGGLTATPSSVTDSIYFPNLNLFVPKLAVIMLACNAVGITATCDGIVYYEEV